MTEKFSRDDDTRPQDRFRYEQPDRVQCVELARELHVPYPLAVLLWQRGMRDTREALKFLNPQLADLPSPSLMKDMDRAEWV